MTPLNAPVYAPARSLCGSLLLVLAASCSATLGSTGPASPALPATPAPLVNGNSAVFAFPSDFDPLVIEIEKTSTGIGVLTFMEPNGTENGSFTVTVGKSVYPIDTRKLRMELRPSDKWGAPFDVHVGRTASRMSLESVSRGKKSTEVTALPTVEWTRLEPGKKEVTIHFGWHQISVMSNHD